METGNNTAVFFCTGCGIGEKTDISKFEKIVSGQSAIFCTDPVLCNKKGVEKIHQTIAEEKCSKILIAACSERTKSAELTFENIISERINIREQVVWSQNSEPEDIDSMIADYITMGLAKLERKREITPYLPDDLSEDILIIGSGITGLSAAKELALAGLKSVVIEKESTPGGFAAKIKKQLPVQFPYTELSRPIVHDIIHDVQSDERIELLLNSEVISISGEPGRFQVELNVSGSIETRNAGSIILANGWKPYDVSKVSGFDYEASNRILTNVDFEEQISSGTITKKDFPKNIVFIQCVGSRDEKHLSYCSGYCCGTTLKQAEYVKEISPETNIFVVYKDMRMPGNYEHFYQSVQNNDRIFFTKGNVTSVTANDSNARVDVNSTLLGEDISIEADMVVLAAGMQSNGSDALKLKYRQGEALPSLKYDFPDSHFICFPYETRRTGIYAAGTVRAPMDIASCMEDAAGAAMKAIQCIRSVKNGKSLHPRTGDQSFPELHIERCTDCKRCTEECPFGMYDENAKGTPLPNPNRCRRCGICLGACPERIISFKDYSIDMISSMIKAVEIPDEFEEKPRILVFACENDAYPALDIAGANHKIFSEYIRVIPVRCIGSVNKIWVSDALSKGYDGILLLGCKPGDDYQCHFIQGSELTKKRAENFQETLQTMMLEPERVKIEFIEINDYDRVADIINEYVDEIVEIGPNPFKGM